jgi:hypothetical protein
MQQRLRVFEVFLTTDQRIRYQQNLANRKIAIMVLTGTSKWSQVKLHGNRIATAVDSAKAGSYSEVFIPFESDSRSSI